MLTNVLTLLAIALVFVVAEMTIAWLVARKLRNNGIVDVVWSAGFAPLTLLYFFLCPTGDRAWDLNPRWVSITTMVVVWSLRLGSHLFVRVRLHHPHEDVRYAKLREEWGAATDRKMFGFFQLQGALQVVLSLPIMLVIVDGVNFAAAWGLGISGCLGVAFWTIGLFGESLADRQLARFRADPANKGRVCQAGLWNYSRHPNYFFEWLVWVGYAVIALGSPMGWLGFIAPALMLHFLLNVTGIPMTEELSLKSKGDAYRAYQRTTSAFVPWFKRTSNSACNPSETLRNDLLLREAVAQQREWNSYSKAFKRAWSAFLGKSAQEPCLVAWATEALCEGKETPSLCILAGMDAVNEPLEVQERFKNAVHELGWEPPSDESLVGLLSALEVVTQIKSGAVQPEQGLREILTFWQNSNYPSALGGFAQAEDFLYWEETDRPKDYDLVKAVLAEVEGLLSGVAVIEAELATLPHD